MTEVLETLKAMRRLLTPEGSWCQGYYCRDSDGNEIYPPHAKAAVSWCLLGACRRVTMEDADLETAVTFVLMDGLPPSMGVPTFNDCEARSQADILALLDERIAALSRPEQVAYHRELEEVL